MSSERPSSPPFSRVNEVPSAKKSAAEPNTRIAARIIATNRARLLPVKMNRATTRSMITAMPKKTMITTNTTLDNAWSSALVPRSSETSTSFQSTAMFTAVTIVVTVRSRISSTPR
jgi:hypothetical protein